MYPLEKRGQAPIAKIQASVASYYGLSVSELVSSTRTAKVAWARQVAIHLARQHTPASLHSIADAFGRNHATVIHACKRVSDRLAQSDEAAIEIQELTVLMSQSKPDRPH